MKLFILILFPFFSFAQASTYEPGDSTWITSSDTSKVKVYKEKTKNVYVTSAAIYEGDSVLFYKLKSLPAKGTLLYNKMGQGFVISSKYDTIGPFWKQISDTTSGYNPVMAMQLYEVRVYKNGLAGPGLLPSHFAWLDLKRKPFKLNVWEDKTLSATQHQMMSIDEANAAGMFNGCPVPNPTIKSKK